ncbi:MAG TPA: T9SS type A sorting domain-containing protein, partial [Bacteroidia bacterium]|nr:T9SS type A sorting domain-containing protein [Bacteroidia bacterium]
ANSATGTYLWLDCNAAYAPLSPAETNQVYTSTANGSYAVEITANGCVDTSACVVISTTGIANNSENVLSVYPNPTMGMFNIAISNANIAELVITIVDIQGKEVFSSVDKNVNGAYNKQINLEEISKGLYYIKMNTGSEVKIQKLIVQ